MTKIQDLSKFEAASGRFTTIVDQETDTKLPSWATGERVVLARPLKAGYCEPDLNGQGTHVLYSRNDLHPAGEQVWLVDIAGADDREVLNVGPEAKVFASWFPDGGRAAVKQAGASLQGARQRGGQRLPGVEAWVVGRE